MKGSACLARWQLVTRAKAAAAFADGGVAGGPLKRLGAGVDGPGMVATLSEIQQALQGILTGTAALPAARLSGAERRALGGLLFTRAPDLVEEVARALRDRRSCFPDVPVDGAALWAQQERASGWLAVCRVLARLLQGARDSYLIEQGEAIRTALRVVQQVQGEAERPFPGALGGAALRRERGLALLLPLRILARRLAKRQAGVRRKRALAG